MGNGRGWKAVLALIGLGLCAQALAGDVCRHVPQPPVSYAQRIAAVACAENALWFGPFIDVQGRLASASVFEGESLPLKDGVTPAWRRVADYWKGTGLLGQMSAFPGASDCSYSDSGHLQAASCRAFLSDTPWSAVFVTYVMNRAGVPGFHGSASHIDYVRAAHLQPETSPYLLADPDATAPAPGDLLCYARMRNVLGYPGLRSFLDDGAAQGLNMHCDIVVTANPGGDNRLYLVGGNVLQGATMRVLPLNRTGKVWGLARRTGVAIDCGPGNEVACSFSRHDWVALLKLKPLPPPTTPMSWPVVPPAPPQCCTQCPLPMPTGMRRCPAPAPRPVKVP